MPQQGQEDSLVIPKSGQARVAGGRGGTGNKRTPHCRKGCNTKACNFVKYQGKGLLASQGHGKSYVELLSPTGQGSPHLRLEISDSSWHSPLQLLLGAQDYTSPWVPGH